jgi:5-methylcytosine-specific restriction enzyme A
MPSLPRLFRPPHLGPRRRAEASRQKALDERRGSKAERGYGRRWELTSIGYRKRNPLCVCCKANARVEAARLVDHIVPHKGDMALFWDPGNWQALCNWCHEHVKKPIEHLFAQGKCSAADLSLARPLPEYFGA